MPPFIKKKRTRSYDLFSSYSYYSPDIKGIIILLLLFLVGSILGTLAVSLLLLFGSMEVMQPYIIVVSYPISFIPPMLYASAKSRSNETWAEEADPIDRNGWGKSAFWTALMVSVAMIAAAILIEPISLLLPEMDGATKLAIERLLKGPLWVGLLSVSVFAPFFEEWLCRGMILKGLLKKMKPVWAIIISGIIFGLIHGNVWQAIPASLIGMLLGYVYWKTGSLKLTMLMHCVNNTLSLALSRLFPNVEYFKDLFPGTGLWILFLVMCAAVLALFFSSFPKKISE